MRINKRYVAAGLLAAVVALAWAGFTQHVWEDYYITFRAAKNLATGHGLVFTVGQRLQTFTSPIGVLLPALASWMTGNGSDLAALWLFRAVAVAALGGAVVLLAAVFRQSGAKGPGWMLVLPVALVLTDAKTVDFSINGMETPFLLLFMAWAFYALIAPGATNWRQLGLAGAAMMWTRPDAFIYLGALAAGAWLFRPGKDSWRDWAGRLTRLVWAGALTVGLYLPWLIWVWWYYGTPVPHTITAKGLFLPAFSAGTLGHWLMEFPVKLWTDPALAAGTLLPAYAHGTGWPHWAEAAAWGLTLAAAVLWVIPKLWWQARTASLGVLAGLFYLYSCVGFPVPWYMPAVTFLALTALGLTLAQVASGGVWRARAAAGVAGIFVAGAAALALAAAWQLHWQQRLVETGNRQKIGVWLKAHAASPEDTVFLEPLGYVGYFSGLRMLDFPGLASREVVAARERAVSHSYPYCWSELIMDLQPDWLVLRPYEQKYINERDPEVLGYYYQLAHDFDVRKSVAAVRFLPGRGYLMNDARFLVYHRRPGLPQGVRIKRVHEAQLLRRDAWSRPAYESGMKLLAHAPSDVEFATAADTGWVGGGFGLLPGAYAHPPNATDGADFTITFITSTGDRTVLLTRKLRPVEVAADRGDQSFRVKLPRPATGRLELRVSPGPHGSNAYDWAYWDKLTIQTPHDWR